MNLHPLKLIDQSFSILIAEDHRVLRELLKDWIISNFTNMRILMAKNGKEAIFLATERKPDLILMDFRMPIMNGIEATVEIKKILPKTHVVILSLCDNDAYRFSSISAGASAFIPKDKLGSVLIATISNLIDKDVIGNIF